MTSLLMPLPIFLGAVEINIILTYIDPPPPPNNYWNQVKIDYPIFFLNIILT